MLVKVAYVLGGVLLMILSYFIYNSGSNSLSPFELTEVDDFYSYISINVSSNEYGKIVVPFGVFFVEKEGDWVYVARMNVSIISCDLINGNKDEGTVYGNRLEYWMLNKSNSSVIGPMNELENKIFLSKTNLKVKKVKLPNEYKKYLNSKKSACTF